MSFKTELILSDKFVTSSILCNEWFTQPVDSGANPMREF